MSHKKRDEEKEVDEDVERIVAEILAMAEKATEQVDMEKIAKQVLAEAEIIARWNKKPFYII